MSDNYYLFKDNIEDKILQNKKYNEILNWLEENHEETVTLIGNFLAPKIKVDKYLFKKIIDKLIEENDNLIKVYVKNSFREENNKNE